MSEPIEYVDIDLAPDGIYLAKLRVSAHTYRLEKANGEWYLSDGTGWKQEFPTAHDDVISLLDASRLPMITQSKETT